MSTTKSRKRSTKLSDTYFDLVRQHPLRSIQNDAELDTAQAVLDELLRRHLDAGETDYLDALSDLVILYEQDQHAIPPLPPHELLAQVLNERSLTQADLVRSTRIAKATVSDLVSGKRPFTVDHMHRLAKALSVPAAAFLAPTVE